MSFCNIMGTSKENSKSIYWIFSDFLLGFSFFAYPDLLINVPFFLGPIAVDEAICHPYLAPLHEINEELVCPQPFVFDFEQPSFTEENIKELIWMESVKLNPDPTHWGMSSLDVSLKNTDICRNLYWTRKKFPKREWTIVLMEILGYDKHCT